MTRKSNRLTVRDMVIWEDLEIEDREKVFALEDSGLSFKAALRKVLAEIAKQEKSNGPTVFHHACRRKP